MVVVNHRGVRLDSSDDINSDSHWQLLYTTELPSISLPILHLGELLQQNIRPDVLLPIDDVLVDNGVASEALALIINHSSRLGVWCSTDTDTTTLDTLLARAANTDSNLPAEVSVDLVLIYMPSFMDGRGFSLAKHLRQQGYGGEIRLAGEFGRDQLVYARRCGIDSFVFADAQQASKAMASLSDLAHAHQGDAASTLPMFR